MKKLKPFDLEAAKAGAEVYTKDGRSVRILADDKKGDKSLVALVSTPGVNGELLLSYYKDGTHCAGRISEVDLRMECKEITQWLNFWKDGTVYSHSTKEKAELVAGMHPENMKAVAVPVTYEVNN